ncbi:MAG: hypothetical protein IJ500_03495 [Alphaproteobacteria bacterium]|nr:hypothetical protein [Alphaproteobacteria bacterium]MBQ8729534.1 hypothetical protein [Alphaproteobacteria bacterium]
MKKIILLLMLSGCGFTPMYVGQDSDIYVAPIRGINGIELRNALNAKFGGVHDTDAKYTLTVNLSEPVTQYKALEQTGDATWQEISISAQYSLTDTATGRILTSGTERAAESYTFVRYLVASNASYNNAVKNSLTVLSDKIGTRAIVATHSLVNTDTENK